MTQTPAFTPLVTSLPASVPFVGPETQERDQGFGFKARLGANESLFGPSPKAISAMQEASGEVWKYGDPENFDLKQGLAQHHGVAPENIIVGEGIDGLLGYLVRMFVVKDTPVVTSLGAYPTFNFHVTGYGGTLHTVPYVDDKEDPASLLSTAKQVDAKLVYFANPDNPMGTWHDAAIVQELIEAISSTSLLILDEAYIEFAPEGTAPPIDVDRPNLIRMRTFSKAYGMAGARIGYAIAHKDLALAFNKVRNHFGVNRVAQAGALAALLDETYLCKVQQEVAQGRDRIKDIAEANGLSTLPSATNFVAIDCGKDGAYAKAVLDGLIGKGVFVRMPFVEPQNRCIRVCVGTAEDMDIFAKALAEVLATAST